MGRSSVGELWQVVTLVLGRCWSKTLQISQGLRLILYLWVSGLQQRYSDEQTGLSTRWTQDTNRAPELLWNILHGFLKHHPMSMNLWCSLGMSGQWRTLFALITMLWRGSSSRSRGKLETGGGRPPEPREGSRSCLSVQFRLFPKDYFQYSGNYTNCLRWREERWIITEEAAHQNSHISPPETPSGRDVGWRGWVGV